jgi:hypothetical protein
VYVPVDKSDLVWARDRLNLFKGHTTEFCFDTNGIYQITTLGRIAPLVKEDPSASGEYTKQMRTVVKVFDILRHTNQFHFEKTFLTGGRSSKNDRKYVITYPDPMAVLTELGSAGSIRDGRVEIAGLLDGNRLQSPVNIRQQTYRTNPQVTMAIGFADRDSRSLTRQRQFLSTGKSFGDEYGDILRDGLDAAFSRTRANNREHLRRSELVSGAIYKNKDAIPNEPIVEKESRGTDIVPDGLHTSILRMPHLGARVLLLPARSRIGDGSSGGNPLVGSSGLSSRGTNVLGNVPYYRGGVAFWVKFDFNCDDPVFSGLIACTQVIEEVSPNASEYKGSEGSQLFIFKNSEGKLRIVRLYYHQAFPDGTSAGDAGGSESGAVNLYPKWETGASGGATGDTSQQNPIVAELDPKKIVSRSDIVVDIRHIRAHEWHHIAVDWNDDDITNPIRLYLDFQEMRDVGAPRKAQDPSTLSKASSWVRLNERQPKDGLQVGGIIREQGSADSGIFKWFTNSADAGTSGGGAAGFVQTVAQSVKRILANATIDELIAFEEQFQSVKQYYGGRGSPGYFSPQRGEYANVFEVPLPPDVDHVTLRSFDWTSYYPVLYTDSRANAVAQKLQAQQIDCQLTLTNPNQPPRLQESWRQPQIQNPVGGRIALRQESRKDRGNVAEVVYKFTMSGARSQVGNTAGGVVQTPVIDDVTLTYFLPNPKILLQEEAD